MKKRLKKKIFKNSNLSKNKRLKRENKRLEAERERLIYELANLDDLREGSK